MACEQDLLSSELETSELEYRGPKPFAEVLCQPTGDTQEIPKSCQGMGSNCRKVKACRDVQSLSREEYLLFLRESFGD